MKTYTDVGCMYCDRAGWHEAELLERNGVNIVVLDYESARRIRLNLLRCTGFMQYTLRDKSRRPAKNVANTTSQRKPLRS